MATWRNAAHLKAITGSLARTTYYQAFGDSDEENKALLPGFLEGRKKEHGHRLVWVALERTEADNQDYRDPSLEWVELERLKA